MIHTVTLSAGTASYSINAQEHAFRIAKWYGALLRVVRTWGAADARALTARGEDPGVLARRLTEPIVERASTRGLRTDTNMRGNGVVEGLLDEARQCDLMVVGLPIEAEGEQHFLERELDDDLTLIRKAECPLLICARPVEPINTILVNYQGDPVSRNALRLAGEIGQFASAMVEVLCIHGDLAEAGRLSAEALGYLKGFKLPKVRHSEVEGTPGDEEAVLAAAEVTEPGLVVIGDAPYGLLQRFMGEDTAEQVALGTLLPVLVAR